MTALGLNTSARKIGDEAMKNHWRKTPKRWQRIQKATEKNIMRLNYRFVFIMC